MIKKIARDIPLFESLGLFTEAPKKKRKPRVISVRPIRKDYADEVDPDESFDIDDPDADGDDLSDYDDLGLDDIDAFDNTDDDLDDGDIGMDDDPELSGDLGIDDIPLDDIGGTGEQPEDGTATPEDTTPSEPQPAEEPTPDTANGPTEPVEDTGTEGEEPVEGGEEPPAEGDGEVIDATSDPADPEDGGDISGGAELDLVPDDGTDPNQMTGGDDPTAGDPNATGEEAITKDDVRKYELFKRFMNLLKSIQYFIEKLENGVSDNENFDIAIKKANRKFKSLETLIKDYMLLKFQTDSYLQNSFFYEKIKASTLLIFKLLEINKNKEDDK